MGSLCKFDRKGKVDMHPKPVTSFLYCSRLKKPENFCNLTYTICVGLGLKLERVENSSKLSFCMSCAVTSLRTSACVPLD